MSQRMLEICVEDVAGVRAAIKGGANRIELCSALALGGLTPSAGLVEAVLPVARAGGIKVHAIVRPRSGDFDYDADALALAVGEARALIASGVDGLVFGATRGDVLDGDALAQWVGAIRADSSTVALTLHRAIDVVADSVAAVDVAVAHGFDRILTSGGAASAPDGAATLARMVARAGDRCRIMAGAGVRPDNAAALLAASGVVELHGSASSAGRGTTEKVMALGFGAPPRQTDAAIVRQLRNILDQA